jgi:hypothetical protein
MANIPSFIFGGNTKYKTQEELEAAREAVRAMLGDIGHSGLTGWGSALADLGKGIGARIDQGRIDEGQEGLLERQAPFSQTLAEIAGSYGGGGDPITGGGGADTAAGGVGTDAVGAMGAYRDAIAKIESGGRYDIIGPHHPKLGRAMGKYQIMEANIGPWSRKHLGREVTPAEFIANPAIQDAIFDGEFAGYVQKYGPEGAAQAWIGGPGAVGKKLNARDSLGTSVGEYGKRFTANLGRGDLSGGGGSNAQAGGGAGDSFLQAKPNRRRMTPQMLGLPSAPEEFDLSTRRRMTPAMLGTDEEPVPPAPLPAPDPARFGGPVPAPAPLPQPAAARFGGPVAPPPYQPPVPQIYSPAPAPQGADPTGDRPRMTPPPIPAAMFNPAPMGPPQSFQPGPSAAVVPGQSMAGTETVPPMPAPRPAPPPAPAPAPATAPAPAVAKVDPFTDMILGDQAKNFRPGGYIPPAPVASAFPVAPPAPGTQQAAGFGVPQQVMAGGGGSNTMVGQGGAFPPAPPAPGQQQAGGGDKIAKLQFILASPYASKEQKLMAASMIEREYALEDERRAAAAAANDPLKKAQLEKAQIEVERLKNPIKQQPISAEERKYWGIPDSDTRPYYINEEGVPALIGGASTVINNNTGEKIADWQGRDANFYDRAASASVDLEQIDVNLASGTQNFIDALPGSAKWGAYVQSPEYLQARNVGDAWIYAILRKESGATLPDAEMKNYRQMFLPQPGEGPEQIESKRQLRKQTEEALALGLKGSAPQLYQSIVDRVAGLRTIRDTIKRQKDGLPPTDETPDKDGWITKPNGSRVRVKQ